MTDDRRQPINLNLGYNKFHFFPTITSMHLKYVYFLSCMLGHTNLCELLVMQVYYCIFMKILAIEISLCIQLSVSRHLTNSNSDHNKYECISCTLLCECISMKGMVCSTDKNKTNLQ